MFFPGRCALPAAYAQTVEEAEKARKRGDPLYLEDHTSLEELISHMFLEIIQGR